MADENQTPPDAEDDSDSLENSEDSLEAPVSGSGSSESSSESSGDSGTIDATSHDSRTPAPPIDLPEPKGFKHRLKRFNLYILLFIFILVMAGGIITIAYFQSKKASVTSTLKTQQLTQQTLQQVANSDATVGSSNQVLNVESSAVFAGKVLIREDLEIAGTLQVGGTAAFSDITVSGTSQLGQVQVNKNLSVAGDTGIQGGVTIAKSLQVSGTASFSGTLTAPQITTTNLQLNSDLVLTHHIIAGGGTPNRSTGPALGSGGTTSVSGSDTGGSISINTGSSPAAGCFVTINFTSKYSSTPHVLVTPVGPGAGGLAYYIIRSTTSFSVCDATAPPSGTSFGFDYFVID